MHSLRSRGRGGWLGAVVLGACLAGSIASGSTQSRFPLASLTVPERNLPAGCALGTSLPQTRVFPDGTTIAEGSPSPAFPFPSNPWSGTERRIAKRIAFRSAWRLRAPP